MSVCARVCHASVYVESLYARANLVLLVLIMNKCSCSSAYIGDKYGQNKIKLSMSAHICIHIYGVCEVYVRKRNSC